VERGTAIAATAYKFLRPGGVGPFSGFAWPLPGAAGAGEWVAASTDRGPCRDGVHACERRFLPRWIWEELWEIELEGEVEARGNKLRAPRGRLLRRVDSWSARTSSGFAAACAGRAAEHAAAAPPHDAASVTQMASDCAAAAGAAQGTEDAYAGARAAAVCSYIAAMTALKSGGRDRHDAERERQAEWLAAELGLAA
jgi:hypothetical protein